MKILKSSIYTALLTILLSSNVLADCSFELFNISSTKGTKIIDFVEQLSDECEFTIIITDPHANEFLDTTLNKTYIKNLTIDEVFNLILNENNLSYTLANNVLKISYLTTKVFTIDYILSVRKSKASTDITLSSSSATQGGDAETSNDAQSESGIKIESNDEVRFWEALDLEFQDILNRPHDVYKADLPVINKNAGLVTVTSTIKQMQRFEEYLKRLQSKVQLQVLIDVQLLLVTMNEGSSTGVDWSQLYALQNLSYNASFTNTINPSKTLGTIEGSTIFQDPTDPSVVPVIAPAILAPGYLSGNNSIVKNISVSTAGELNEVIKFLQTQGDVNALSNPKVLTLNNQPALITVGTEYFYKLKSSESTATGGTAVVAQQEEVKSVFSGILLDITPEISEDRTITLKINPSVSEINGEIPIDPITGQATMPPNLDRRQLSSVVTVKDGKRIILGGLINVKDSIKGNQVPLLGNIPILGYLFKYEEKSKVTQELVIIIEAHIIDKEHSNLSLKDLGYKSMTEKHIDVKIK